MKDRPPAYNTELRLVSSLALLLQAYRRAPDFASHRGAPPFHLRPALTLTGAQFALSQTAEIVMCSAASRVCGALMFRVLCLAGTRSVTKTSVKCFLPVKALRFAPLQSCATRCPACSNTSGKLPRYPISHYPYTKLHPQQAIE